jgi:hypothetical protein
MSAIPITTEKSDTAAATPPRFDRQFIEEHHIVARYLENKLPPKGAREFENWCRANPEYLDELHLTERTQASFKLLEASGAALDLTEQRPPWWREPYVLVGMAIVTVFSILAFAALFGKYLLLRGRLEDARFLATQGGLVATTIQRNLVVAPSRVAGLGAARISVNRGAPQLVDLLIDMNYTKETLFRVVIDKREQGRVLVLANLLKDSNGDLRMAFNTSALAGGLYDIRIEALPFSGPPTALGWLVLDAH